MIFQNVQTLEIESRLMRANACGALGSALQKNALPNFKSYA